MTAAPPARTLRSLPIGGTDIGRCLTRLHHDRFTPVRLVPDAVKDRAIERGIRHERQIVDEVLDATPDAIAITRVGRDAESATLAALRSGAPVVVGGRLRSADGNLVGIPDVLVRLVDGYAPVEIKHHKVIGDTGIPARPSRPSALSDMADEEVRFRSFRRRDLLQVAHYRRLLEAHGFASAAPWGGVIGSEDPATCLWVDLAEGEPSVLDDCDAHVAAARDALHRGASAPGVPVVPPAFRGECKSCDWREFCLEQMVAIDDPTLLRDVDTDTRAALAHDGIATVADVAAMEPDDERLPHGAIVLQARARTAGSLLRPDRSGASMALPHPSTEIDFDIETIGGRTYLAGLLITVDGSATYEPIVEWSGSESGERDLLIQLFERFAEWSASDTLVYHWTDYERRTLVDAAERFDITVPGFESVSDWFDEHAFDLCAWARRHLVSPDGYGLKAIAPLCGFRWRDVDPGGLQSEIWFERLLAGEDAMRGRLLAYNEDDVLAQAAVRAWVREHDDGRGPGSSIPSVLDWPPTSLP